MLNMIRPCLYASSEDLAHYLIGQKASQHYQIFCVLEADGNLDERLLMLAAKWAYQAEPVLSCQLVPDAEKPYWKRRISYNHQEICSMVETEDVDYAVQSFMAVSLDPCQDSLVQVRLVRKANKDFLCVKISHVCCDAVGIKEYIAILAEAYNALTKGQAFTRKSVTGRRDLTLILEQLGLKNYQELPKRHSVMSTYTRGFPALSREHSIPRWGKCFIGKNEYNKLKNYAAASAVTVHDVLLTAFSRAYPRITGQLNIEYSVIVTTDLRRFAQNVSAVANFSGGFMVNAANYAGESFAAALARVARTTQKGKSGLPGVNESLELNEALRLSFADFSRQFANQSKALEDGSCPPLFSNTGFFTQQVIRLGETTVSNAYILPPPLFAPGFLLLMSSYDNILAISAGYYQPAVPKETVDIFMKDMLQELKHCY
ncbi:MAG: hypothetical protein LLG02_01715 [Pelosinus sp.]|nr:hypothetical protein [Pelosinus sp.]